jgi:hypothetical protein
MKNHFIRLGGVLVTVLGVVAGVAETCNWLRIEPEHIGRPITACVLGIGDKAIRALYWMTSPSAREDPVVEVVSGKRPVRMVLIIENQGDIQSINRLKPLVAEVASRLVPEDSVSLITFTNDSYRYRFVFTDEPGKTAPKRLADKIHGLFPLSTIPAETVQAASEHAKKFLASVPSPSMSSVVIELSADTPIHTINTKFQELRSDAPVHGLVLGPREVRDKG